CVNGKIGDVIQLSDRGKVIVGCTTGTACSEAASGTAKNTVVTKQPTQISGPGTPTTTGSPNKADRPESAFGGPMSAQNPDSKRLINDDPAGSPGDVGAIEGYAQGQKDYEKGIDQGFNAQPEG